MKQKLFGFAKILKERFLGVDMTRNAVMITYYMLLSLFPIIIVAGNLLAMFGIEPQDAIPYIETLLPEVLLPVMQPIVVNLLTTASAGLLSISLLGALWSASKSINHLQVSANMAYGLGSKKSFLAKRIISLFSLLLILVVLAALILVFSFGEAVLEWIGPVASWTVQVRQLITSLKWPVTLGVSFLILTVLYRVAPEVKVRIRDAMPGALLASVGLLLLVRLFAVYVLFATSLSGYGALGTFFVMMIWLNWSARIVIAGAVFNASLQQYRFGEANVRKNRIDTLIDGQVMTRVHQAVDNILRQTEDAEADGPDTDGEDEM